jgi:hypothetical protein
MTEKTVQPSPGGRHRAPEWPTQEPDGERTARYPEVQAVIDQFEQLFPKEA